MRRRDLIAMTLAGALACGAAQAGTGILTQPRPRPRPAWATAGSGGLAALVRAHALSGQGGAVLIALADGAVVEAWNAALALPPASVAKAVTAIFALDHLGPDYRFATWLVATGPLEGDMLAGDLVLAGSGDPVLDTDALAGLAAGLAASGIRAVRGRFRVAAPLLPGIAEITPGQPRHAPYNPAVAGLNLNFNRIFLDWRPVSGGFRLDLSVPASSGALRVEGIRAELVARDGRPFVHAVSGTEAEAQEIWAVAQGSLGGAGSAWLPVRRPVAHAAEVFRLLAAREGVALPVPEAAADVPRGQVIARHDSPPVDRLVADMLRYSTNLTAEILGLRAAQAGGLSPGGLGGSARAMAAWMAARHRVPGLLLDNHSGLSDAARTRPLDLARLFGSVADGPLPRLLRVHPLVDGSGAALEIPDKAVVAKTGTMHFVRGLAGYLGPVGRPSHAFAILSADLAARAGIAPDPWQQPPGAAGWGGRARALEQAILRRWLMLHG